MEKQAVSGKPKAVIAFTLLSLSLLLAGCQEGYDHSPGLSMTYKWDLDAPVHLSIRDGIADDIFAQKIDNGPSFGCDPANDPMMVRFRIWHNRDDWRTLPPLDDKVWPLLCCPDDQPCTKFDYTLTISDDRKMTLLDYKGRPMQPA